MLLSRRLARIASVLGLLIAGVAPFITDHPVVSAQEGPALLVDDAETANPDLVEVEVGDPAGFGVSGQTLQIPPGYTVSAVAAGLGDPRFMDFDDAGNLLVGTGRPGYRLSLPVPCRRWPARGAGGSHLGTAAAGQRCHLHRGRRPVPLRRRDPSGQPLSATTRRDRSVPRRSSSPISPREDIAPGRSPSVRTGCSTWRSDRPATSVSRRSRSARLSPGPIRTGAIWRSSPPGCATRSGSPSNPGPICSGRRSTSATTRATRSRPIWSRSSKRARTMAGRPVMPPDATPQEPGADCSGVTPPTIGIQAHSAPLGLAFLDGEGVPSRTRRRPHRRPARLLEPGATGRAEAAADRLRGWGRRSRRAISSPVGRMPAASAGAVPPV